MVDDSLPSSPRFATDSEQSYNKFARTLHWTMAIGFVLMWLSGVFVTNIEGIPFWAENDRQGVVRDLHKSVGLTLLGLLLVRIVIRFTYRSPALPATIGTTERWLAGAGHFTIYAVVIAASLSGLSIADVHEYGNSFFGIALPQIFPTTESIAGFGSTPWAYVIHALFVYGLLVLVVGHVASVVLHKAIKNIDLLPRMTERASKLSLRGLSLAVIVLATLISFFAMRAIATEGPLEEPRDYIGTTPFAK